MAREERKRKDLIWRNDAGEMNGQVNNEQELELKEEKRKKKQSRKEREGGAGNEKQEEEDTAKRESRNKGRVNLQTNGNNREGE